MNFSDTESFHSTKLWVDSVVTQVRQIYEKYELKEFSDEQINIDCNLCLKPSMLFSKKRRNHLKIIEEK